MERRGDNRELQTNEKLGEGLPVAPMKYMVDVYIPPECLEAGDCIHSKKPVKRDTNPL